ncbi:D-glycero-beta-D-manno-heptose 1,7-bisphosphate 7-phosphatase [Alteromonas sp. C1M14]|uniref:D-glycero-beta-D-manno-heptose 1,7-bisphosphate 7-phosphatase n=1 Tax=Alteromonas sp. C1M14 TaxID=2841567 RepID=UPI001C09E354|nr:D-glycero-beta-D-manno-heptose 1,7-bisphosphate 7-phosphatase [Alteromonas sp. C1M14]MBU2977493.1 D-glycero-beta-D-manno-heptose 1,7-bisphosphate 7-phosphatase [Alteromonas sp. C1M14]
MNNPAFFLDRDGVINIDHGYISTPAQFDFVPGVFNACRKIVDAGYKIIVVTNQSGIARGYYTEEAFADLTNWMVEEFAQQGVGICDVQYCPHHPTHGDKPYVQNCQCRKPNPGMIIDAATQHGIDLSQSVMVGDKESDMQAGSRAGIPTLYKVSANQQGITRSPLYTECHDLAVAVDDFLSN